ncbi:MAG: BlaI/MecI/CopY family transcriptional regulator [Xanthomonadales bacterium]|nr:BlaI/MecI/CopY family transcriptional regulator [Xanthomonadales bacterium]
MVRDRGSLPQPTKTELNILRILWVNGESTVREVHEALNEEETSGYTTALKMLQVMHQKGLVKRDVSQRAHVYSAAVSKAETQSNFLSDMVNRLFDGSTSQLVLQALGNSPTADKLQMEKIEALLAEIEDG